MRNVFVIGAYQAYIQMFLDKGGWVDVDSIEDADLVVFCGGEDVSPDLYNQHAHSTTYNNPERDEKEKHLYNVAKELGIPCAGICRGGQFLHVLNGGSLFQDVDNHAISGTHEAMMVGNLIPVNVTSTHHQMMDVDYKNENCIVLLQAKLSTRKSNMSPLSCPVIERSYRIDRGDDVEAVYWSNTNDLCFQPHPEFDNAKECRDVFFSFVETYLFGEN